MSVRKNIPQHPVDTRFAGGHEYSGASLSLDSSWWPASRPRSTDGRANVRVLRRMYAAARNAANRLGDWAASL